MRLEHRKSDGSAGNQSELQSTEIAVFYNDGNANFTQQVIAPTGSQNQTLGGDGDSDIRGANHGYFGAPDEASSSLTPWKVDARPSVAGVDATPSHAVPGKNCGYICDGSGATMLVDLSQAITVWPNTNYMFTARVDASSTTGGTIGVRTTGGINIAPAAFVNIRPGPS